MKKQFLFLFIILCIILAGGFWWLNSRPALPSKSPVTTQINPMQIISPAFLNNQNIPSKYTCDGEGINPPLGFKDIPANTQSLVLIVDDPDAPMDPPAGGWVHWTLWNIDPAITSIVENSVPPKAIAGQTSSGQNVYGGPCPPSGAHRYFFKLYALDSKLSVSSFSLKEDLEKAMQGHIISYAELVGLYSRTVGGK